MRGRALFTLVVFSFLSSGCGSNSSDSKNATPALNGNWSIRAVSQTTGTIYLGGANLYTVGGTVTGILHFTNMPCGFTVNGIMYDTPVTGTISSNGNLQLSTTDINGLTLNIKGMWSSGSISSATYTISGKCEYENGDHGSLTGFPVPSLSGTYTGNFQSASGEQVKATMVLSQSGPNSHGIYSLTGTAAFSGSPCFFGGTIDVNAYDFMVGGVVQFPIVTSHGALLFQGQVTNGTGNTITGQYEVTEGSCAGDVGSGSASRT
jgi:hypothetical protein